MGEAELQAIKDADAAAAEAGCIVMFRAAVKDEVGEMIGVLVRFDVFDDGLRLEIAELGKDEATAVYIGRTADFERFLEHSPVQMVRD